MRLRKAGVLLACLWGVACFAGVRPAFAALKVLQRQEARDYIGDKKQKFTGGGYTYEILRRSHRDSMNGRFSDGVIFTSKTNRFYYRNREDNHHIVILGHPQGREEDPAVADAPVWRPIENALQDDHPDPHVFLDEQGQELAVVYIGRRTQLKATPSSEGILEIEIRVTTAAPPRHRGNY